jgi:hypothetical protein
MSSAPRSIEEYLRQLREALDGAEHSLGSHECWR